MPVKGNCYEGQDYEGKTMRGKGYEWTYHEGNEEA